MMSQLSNAQNPHQPLRGGDALLIVPPFFVVTTPCLAVHVLQACAREAGFQVSVLYANMSLASVLGLENYTAIGFPVAYPPQTMLGERLFARSAHDMPALGNQAERISDLDTTLGESRARERWTTRVLENRTCDLGLAELEKLEERAMAWIDKTAVEVLSPGFKLVGCSTTFAQTNASFALLKSIKKYHPQTTTILGGANCRGDMAQGILSLDPAGMYIDYVFSGESESTFVKFLQEFFSGQLPSKRMIPGAPCLDLDMLPPTDFTEYFEQLEHFLPGVEANSDDVSLLYEASRGCWWGQRHHCTFCGINGDSINFRHKSPELVLNDFRKFVETWPARRVIMTDSIMPYAYLETLLPQLAEAQLPLSISYTQKANLSLSDVLALKNAGISLIEPGIESLSSNLLRQLNKGVLARQNMMLLRYARAVGLELAWGILWGFPNDKLQDYMQMLALLPLMHHLPPPGALLHLSIDRFSPYFEHPEKFGIHNITPLDGYRAVFPSYADVEKLAYHFMADYECAAHQNPGVIETLAQEITAWQKCWSVDSTSPVVLHVFPSGDHYLLFDTRGLSGTQTMQVLNRQQALVALTARPFVKTPEIMWALESKLGVIVDDWYVPLATADPDLLQTFEDAVDRTDENTRP